MPKSAVLEVRALSFTYPGSNNVVLSNLELDVRHGESIAIVGLSGTGKSTLLRLMAGLAKPTGGGVFVDGSPLLGPSRRVALVFQQYDHIVFPWLTVPQNILLGASATDRSAKAAEARRLATLLGIGRPFEAEQKGGDLSGGQKQRVAIARALLQQARVVLMDEPFSSLDDLSRHLLTRALREIGKDTETSFVIVSHDIEEALVATQHAYCLLPSNQHPQLVDMGRFLEDAGADADTLHAIAAVHQRVEAIMDVLRKYQPPARGAER